MKINYWEEYYKKKNKTFKPSNFAKFLINKKFIKKDSVVLDLGCGDGRDTFYFSNNVKKVFGFDKSKIIIKKNSKLSIKSKMKNISFERLDLGENTSYKRFNKINFSVLYARFFIHAVNERLENKLINIITLLPKKFWIVFEFRTIKDSLMNKGRRISKFERITDHYRRFIDVNNFLKKFDNKKIKILYKKEALNLSKYKRDNPHLCRLILSKK